MGIYYVSGIPYSSDYLQHFGILGMHWGIRRFQNPDGTLTAAGKKRYAKELKEKEEAEKRQVFEKERAVATDQIVKDFSNTKFFVTVDTESKRAKDAADTGLKALARLNRSSQYGLEDLDSMDEQSLQLSREWFILEDQTVGLATIADLANQGKSKSEIRSYIDKAFEYTQKYGYPESKNDDINSAVFLLAENGNIKNTEAGLRYGKYVDDFIDACIKERRIKHSDFAIDELYHHGIKGQRWGIRRYQNPDGTLTAAGKERYTSAGEQKKFANKLAKAPGDLYYSNSPQMKAALRGLKECTQKHKKAVDEIDKEVDAFYKNKKLYQEYTDKAIDQMKKDWPQIFEQHSEEWVKKYSDFLQGSYDPYEMFINSGDSRSKKLVQAINNEIKTDRQLRSVAKNYAKEFLGDYGKMTVRNGNRWNRNGTVEDRFVNNIAFNSNNPLHGKKYS